MWVPIKKRIEAVGYKLRTRKLSVVWLVLLLDAAGWLTVGALLRVCRSIFDRAPGDPRRILLIRADRIGDMILTTPAFRLLRARFPHAHITCLASALSGPLVQYNPFLNAIAIFDPPWFERAHRKGGLKQYLGVYREIRRGGYDMAIDFRGNFWNYLLLMFLPGIPRRVSFGSSLGSFLLTDTVEFEPGRHETQYCMDLVSAVGGGVEAEPQPTLVLRREEADYAKAFFERNGLRSDLPTVVIHPGSGPGRILKCWPPDRYVEMATLLRARRPVQFVVSGSPAEVGVAQRVVDGIGNGAVLAAGRIPDLRCLAAVIRGCDVCVGSSTGIIHLASAVGVPTVVLSGPEDDRRWHPLGPHLSIRHDVPCRPCREKMCSSDGRCMNLITPAEVTEAICALLRPVGQ